MGMHQVMSGREQHPGDASVTDQEAQCSRQTTLKQMLHSRHVCELAVLLAVHKLRLHNLHVGRHSTHTCCGGREVGAAQNQVDVLRAVKVPITNT